MTAREIIFSLPAKFNPETAPGADTVFHFKITGNNASEFTAVLKDGACTVAEGLEGDAKCVVTTSEETFIGILDKSVNAQMAVFTGKLKISNLSEMMKYAKAFGMM